ncbi:class I SAM-dependent methyltransferase [Nonomuraea diastatica]|uniref:Class I SAM-dependent methyltransferase n=1 Tax=Nonomuraea diastatica TaxID=1848329 RepID=A0A4R4WZR3_9ACTN|nr:class I SAM-dependent methyltransferase [Nonomuraea diastatica]TDD23399.1 class I SAM-dependent methyltransferase [Nonomuraea diastatica]
MPTIPPGGNQPYRLRQVAESFGTDAERYDRTRPRYPDALVERIVAAGPGPDLLDVGTGTGIAARQFQAAGCKVLGVEPDERMAGLARHTGVECEVSTFETWDAAGRTFDTVTAGQTWHWVDPVAGAAKAAEVLRPGGRLALFWNVFQLPPGLNEAFATAYREVLPEMPVNDPVMPAMEAYSVMFTQATDGMREAGAFSDPEQWHFGWEHSYTRDEWLDQVPTHGGSTRLPPAKLDELLSAIGAAIDARGGAFTMGYTAVVVTATRTATA